jgi:hypothetical protein
MGGRQVIMGGKVDNEWVANKRMKGGKNKNTKCEKWMKAGMD